MEARCGLKVAAECRQAIASLVFPYSDCIETGFWGSDHPARVASLLSAKPDAREQLRFAETDPTFAPTDLFVAGTSALGH